MRASVKHFGVVSVTTGQVADGDKKAAFITRYISCRKQAQLLVYTSQYFRAVSSTPWLVVALQIQQDSSV